jgi:hypothetical protein
MFLFLAERRGYLVSKAKLDFGYIEGGVSLLDDVQGLVYNMLVGTLRNCLLSRNHDHQGLQRWEVDQIVEVILEVVSRAHRQLDMRVMLDSIKTKMDGFADQ